MRREEEPVRVSEPATFPGRKEQPKGGGKERGSPFSFPSFFSFFLVCHALGPSDPARGVRGRAGRMDHWPVSNGRRAPAAVRGARRDRSSAR